jgi:hypothetical protein
MYTNGYRKEPLLRTARHVIRMLSLLTKDLEREVRNVFEARIPDEANILVNHLLNTFSKYPPPFVLAEIDEFKQTSLYGLVDRKIKKMTIPRPSSGTASLDIMMRDIRNNDVLVICYDGGAI